MTRSSPNPYAAPRSDAAPSRPDRPARRWSRPAWYALLTFRLAFPAFLALIALIMATNFEDAPPVIEPFQSHPLPHYFALLLGLGLPVALAAGAVTSAPVFVICALIEPGPHRRYVIKSALVGGLILGPTLAWLLRLEPALYLLFMILGAELSVISLAFVPFIARSLLDAAARPSPLDDSPTVPSPGAPSPDELPR
jgi:hypothetical protein